MIEPTMDPERPIRIRPRVPKRVRDDARMCPAGFRRLLHIFQMTKKAIARRTAQTRTGGSFGRCSFTQRCAVRVTYSANKVNPTA
jgi:hypothetical protein